MIETSTETRYKGQWIELSESLEEGLYQANVRITDDSPAIRRRRWHTLHPDRAVYFDFASARDDALEHAKLHIDEMTPGGVA